MIFELAWLQNQANDTRANIGGLWVPARPITGTFRWERLRDAWEVFRGRADAFRWPGNQ